MNTFNDEIKKENKKKRFMKEKNLKSEIDKLNMISSQTFDKINKFCIYFLKVNLIIFK